MATPGEVLYFETAPREANAWGNLNHEQREHWEREANHRAADKALTLLRDRLQQAEKREADLLTRVSQLEKQTSDDALLTADFSERILKLERTPFNPDSEPLTNQFLRLRNRLQQAEKREADLLTRVSRLETFASSFGTRDLEDRVSQLEAKLDRFELASKLTHDRIASALETIAKQWPVCPRCNQPVTPSLGIHLCPDGKAP